MSKDFCQIEWDRALEDDCRQIVRLAVREDLDRGCDWTTVALVDEEQRGRASIVAREDGVIVGLRAGNVLLDEMHADIRLQPRATDGDQVTAGSAVAQLDGSARDLLTCERPLLNMIGRLSGIATLTRKFVRHVQGAGARIYDTRKTTPGWRRLEKYAVRCGGGRNHRVGLFDAVLIKDNHLLATRSAQLELGDAVSRVRQFLSHQASPGTGRQAAEVLIEIEVDTLEQLRRVLPTKPDIVLLDNMTCDQLRAAVTLRNELAVGVELEASGGVNLQTVREIAQTGVERISAGALTHSAHTLDVGLDWHTGT